MGIRLSIVETRSSTYKFLNAASFAFGNKSTKKRFILSHVILGVICVFCAYAHSLV
jgi:hypothetical protein